MAQAQNIGTAWLERARNLHPSQIKTNDHAPATRTAIRELTAHWQGGPVMLERDKELNDDDGFTLTYDRKRKAIIIKALHSRGLLYGAYELLRAQAADCCEEVISITQKPSFALRIATYYAATYPPTDSDKSHNRAINLNEIDGKRGTMSVRMRENLTQYCRTLASIGINGMVLHVSDGSATIMSQTHINKVKLIASVCRDYGIKLYLTADLTSPSTSLSLSTINANGENPEKWWKDRMKSLYRDIPDLGGFVIESTAKAIGNAQLVQAEIDMKASILAEAIVPYNGIVLISRNVTAPKSLIFDNENNISYGEINAHSQYKNIINLLIDEAKSMPPIVTFTPAVTSARNNSVMIQLQSAENYQSDTTNTELYAKDWSELLSVIPKAKMRGVMFKQEEGNWSDSANGIQLQAELYSFGRLTWNAKLPTDSLIKEISLFENKKTLQR